MKLHIARMVAAFWLLVLSLTSLTLAQTPAQAASALPRLVRFGGTVKDLNGKPLTGVVRITFAFYSEKTGGAPLWLETQSVTADSSGHYAVLLGSTKPEGLPADLFTSEQARWVGGQVAGQAEQPRVLLVSAPYALKAGDAETIGGLPPSAFVLAAPIIVPARVPAGGPEGGSAAASGLAASTAEAGVPATSDVTTTGGTVNAIPLFSTSTNIQNSILTQTATTTVSVGGKLNLPATAAATKTEGADSRPIDFVASSFSSSTSAAENQTFQWQAEPAANDTAAPSGTLNLLYGLGTATPTETGLKLSSKGVFTFAAGQTFPGGGSFCIATSGGFGGGGTTFVAPAFAVPAENKCTAWSGFTKTASTVILLTNGAACLSTTGKTLTVSVSSVDPDFLGTTPASDYIQLTRTSSSGVFTGGSDQGEFSGSADQITCTSSLLSLPDVHD
jgi:hypothetical protein